MSFSPDFSFDDKPKNSPNVIALFNAASRNQLEKLNDIICKNASVQVTEDVNGFNCFHVAAKKGHIEIVKRIHSLYPDIVNTQTSDNQRSSLMLAAFEGHDSVVQYLSKLEIAPATDALGNNALHYACWGGNISIVKLLIEENIIDPSTKNAEGLTAIQFAIAGKHIEIVQYLSKLSSGSLVAETTDSGLTGLHRAAIYGSLETIKLLLSANCETVDAVSIESRAYNGNTVLHLSAQHGGMDIIQYFIEECSATVNVQNDYDLTPLHFACLGGHLNIAQYLISHGADVHVRNTSGSTALHLAATSGHHSICALLAEQRDIQLMSLDSEGHSPIDLAITSGFKELAAKIAMWSCMELRSKKLYEAMCETRE